MRSLHVCALAFAFGCSPKHVAPQQAERPLPPATSAWAATAAGPFPSPPPRRDPWAAWAGPLVWKREPLTCAGVKRTASNAGVNGWRSLKLATPSSLTAVSVSAADGDDVWIVGSEGSILHTADNGKTFMTCTAASKEALVSVWAASRDEAWILGETHLFRVEGGTTLATLSVDLQGHCGSPRDTILGMAPDDIWLASGALLHTTDRGSTWRRVPACGEDLVDSCSSEIATMASERWTDCPFSASRSSDKGATWRYAGWPPSTEEQMHVSLSGDDVFIVGQSYATNPGQALSYRVGMESVAEQRTRAEQALGTKFSAKAFNKMLLGLTGTRSLIVNTDAFIAANK